MALYNRIRVIALKSSRYNRDSTAAREEFDPIFEPLGARYAGYCIEQGARRHFYMIDDPTDDQVAALLKLSRTVPISMIREYKGMNPVSYDIDSIVRDVARILRDEMLAGSRDSMELARCWSGVRILENLARN